MDTTTDTLAAPHVLRSKGYQFNWQLELLLPALSLIVLAIVLTGELDMRIASWIYSVGGDAWTYKDAFWTKKVIHKGGRLLTSLGVLSLLTLIVLSFLRPNLQRWRKPSAWLFVAIAVSTGTVSLIKRYSGLECPWSISGLGGMKQYITLFDARALGPGCFPAGHASGGYAWIALYFFFAEVHPKYRPLGLAIGMSVGLTFGIGQQFRGAHFLSHDVVAALICWSVPALILMARQRYSDR